ncbi:hypothetical protein [Brevibacillus sp. HD3.3A]|uniref:hypothetical protein n=1 Tax=Brevibacillus sp. HD3.3A TaxID=2738979 RepID=UPI00156A7985|nr:hypothetical protein [Brevibacillus sp. HD3.3A]UED70690.1 hypothetical protein HP435_08665 [Brevibacillus sp. HD3.3A]
MDALKLSNKVRRIIDRHIRQKGYEIEVELETVNPNNFTRNPLTIWDDGTEGGEPHKETVKIVVTGHDLEENSTPIGDNPDEVLNFISIETGTEPDERQIKEGRILQYNNKRYNILLVAPATLAGQLIIKECKAKAVI